MIKSNKVILVTGATGQQGGSVARQLLYNGWYVCALTRNPDSPAAQALRSEGAVIAQGDLDDQLSLESALDGVYGVYSFPNMAGGLQSEIKQGKLVADIAQKAGVKHFVQSSVGGVERKSGVPHFESKWLIEEHVRSLGLPATFLRPTFFMENLNWKRDHILSGSFESLGIISNKSLQMIAVEDIGKFAVLAFDNPSKYINQGVELAGDELTEAQIVEVMSKVLGRPIDLIPPMGFQPTEDMAKMVEWFNENGYEADIPALRIENKDLMTLEDWLKKNNWQSDR
jgi:uncharacterized protein YbjT (DUF2867 family)